MRESFFKAKKKRFNKINNSLNDLLQYIAINHINSREYEEIDHYNPRFHSSIMYSGYRTDRKNDFYINAKNARQTAKNKIVKLIKSSKSEDELNYIINRVFDYEILDKKPLLTYRMSKLKWEDRNLCMANDECCAPVTFLFCLPKNLIPSRRYFYKGVRVSHLWKTIIVIAESKKTALAKDKYKNHDNSLVSSS